MNQPADRNPVLNKARLADLSVAATALGDDIAYLDDMLAPSEKRRTRAVAEPTYPPDVLVRFRDKRDALVRAKAWLEQKVEVEKARREGG